MKHRRCYAFLAVSLILFTLLMLTTLREAHTQAPYQVTFTATGLDSDAGSNTVLTLGGTNYAWNTLPTNFEVDSEGTTFTWASTVSGGSGKQFVEIGDSGLDSPITANGTDAATYKTQYLVAFSSSGLGADASGNLVSFSVSGGSYSGATSPISVSGGSIWVDSGASVSYSFVTPVSSTNTGEQYLLGSVTGATSPITVSGANTLTGVYVTQYDVSFTATGLDSDAGSNTVLTVGPTNYAYNALPSSVYVDSGTTFSWTATVSGGSGKQFVETGSSGASPITAAGTYSATYKTQWSVTFQQSGLGSDASGTVLTVGSSTYTYSTFPSSTIWVDDGTTFSYTNPVPAGSDKQYEATGVAGVSSPVHSTGTVTGNYKTQYQHTITSSPATGSGYVTVDGGAVTTPYTTPWWDSASPHTIAANSPVTLVSGQSQYIYSSWSDSGAQSHSVSPTAVTTYTAVFQLQYNFSVSSAHDNPTGAGWHNAGSSVSSTITRPVSGGTGTQYETTSWTGTGSLSSGGSAGSSSTGSFTLNAYTTCTWNWKTQYLLTVSSAYDTPGGGAWYDSGSPAYATLSSGTVSGGAGTQYVFTSWGTDASGTNYAQSGAITMNAAKTATANWKTQYQITFGQTGVGSDFLGTVVTIDSINLGISSLPVSFWYDSGSSHSFWFASILAVGSKQYVWGSTSGLSTQQSGTLTVTASGSVVGNYQVQNQVTFDKVGVGSDFTGAVVLIDSISYSRSQLPVSFSWSLGSTHNFAFQSYLVVGSTTERYVWTSTTGLSSAQSGSVTITTYGSVIGNYKTQYYLTVSSPYDSPSPASGWFDSGSSVTESVTSPVSGGSGTQYVCTGWTGTGSVPASGTSSSVTFTMTGASSITWNWQVVQRKLTVFSAHDSPSPAVGDHLYDDSSSVTCSVSSQVNETGTVWTCTGWTGTGSVNSSGSGLSVTFAISQNSTITWNWHGNAVQRTLTVSSAHDNPSPAVGNHLYDDGDSVNCSITSPVTESNVTYVCTGWSGSGSVPSSGSGTSVAFTITQNSNITWNWQVVQWTLTVVSAHGSPSPSIGDHLYNDGSSVVCNVSSPVVEGGVSYTRTGWVGSGSVPSSGGDVSVMFSITQNSSITWIWTVTPSVQWKLTVSSAHGSPDPAVGDHLYGNGSSVVCNVSSPVVEGGVSYTCTGWTGTGSVTSNGSVTFTSFTIIQNSTMTWNWVLTPSVQWTLTVKSAHGSPSPAVGDHLYDSGRSVACSITSPVTEAGEVWTCTGWTGTGSVTPSGSGTSVSFNLTENSNITWNWRVQPTIGSCDGKGVQKDVFNLNETIFVTGRGYGANQTYNVYFVNETTWFGGMAIPGRVQGTATSLSSDSSGNINPTVVCSKPLTSGNYDILVDYNGNGKYDAGVDALYSSKIKVSSGYSFIPEYVFGTILGLAGCFAALGAFRIYKRKR